MALPGAELSPVTQPRCPHAPRLHIGSKYSIFFPWDEENWFVGVLLDHRHSAWYFTWVLLICPIILQNRYCYFHLTDGKTEIQRDSRTLPMRDIWTALRLIFPSIPGDLEITGQQDRVISTEEQVTTGPIPELPSLPLPGNTKELLLP